MTPKGIEELRAIVKETFHKVYGPHADWDDDMYEIASSVSSARDKEWREKIEALRKKLSPYERNHGMPENNRATMTNANRMGWNAALDDLLTSMDEKV